MTKPIHRSNVDASSLSMLVISSAAPTAKSAENTPIKPVTLGSFRYSVGAEVTLVEMVKATA